MVSLTSFGGSGGIVTGSKHLLDIDGDQFLVDCGQYQGSQELELNNRESFSFKPSRIKAVLLTSFSH